MTQSSPNEHSTRSLSVTNMIIEVNATSNIWRPSVCGLTDGGFVLVWGAQDAGTDYDVIAQAYNANGTHRGDQIIVSGYTAQKQWYPSAIATDQGFVVAFQDQNGQDGSQDGVLAKRYSNDLVDLSPGVQIILSQDDPSSFQWYPEMCASNDGSFFLAIWADWDGAAWEIAGKFFNSDGTSKTAQFAVNQASAGEQEKHYCACLANGQFVVTWRSTHADTGDIYARAFYDNGVAVGNEFIVNTFTTDEQDEPSIAALPNGKYVIAWDSDNYSNSWDVVVRIFTASHVPSSSEILVNDDYVAGWQYEPSVVSFSDSSFAVAYIGNKVGVVGEQALLRAFNSDGTPKSAGSTVVSDGVTSKFAPHMAGLTDDSVVLVWESQNDDEIEASRIDMNGNHLCFGGGTNTADCPELCNQYYSPCTAPLVCYEDQGFCGCEEDSQCTDPDFPRCDLPSTLLCQAPCHENCETCYGETNANQCVTCIESYYLESDDSCQACDASCLECDGPTAAECTECDDGFYLESGECLPCHEACGECTGPLQSDCQDCVDGYFLDDDTCLPCDSACETCTGPFWNECLSCNSGYQLFLTSCLPCHDACSECTGSLNTQCQACNPGYFLNYTTCNSCFDPECKVCSNSGEYDCTECNEGHYLDEINACQDCDKTCASCSGPQATQCLECDEDYPFRLLETMECVACKDPFIQDGNSCLYPCDISVLEEDEMIFYYKDSQKCENFCDGISSYAGYDLSICTPDEEISTARAQAKSASQVQSAGISIAALQSSLSTSAGPTAFNAIILTEMLSYIRYISAPYSAKTITFFSQLEGGSLIPIDPPASLEEAVTNHTIPDNFAKYGLHSSFIVGYWEDFITLLSIFAFVMLTVGISTLLHRKRAKKEAIRLSYQLQYVFRWNLFLLVFCGSYDEITLFSFLDLRSVDKHTGIDIFSSLCAIAMLIIGFALLGQILYLVSKSQKLKNPQTHDGELELRQFNRKWQFHQVMFRAYKQDSFWSQSFLFFFMLRALTYYFVVSFMYEFPQLQVIILTTSSAAMMVYIIYNRPFLRLVNKFEQITYEIIIFVANLLIMALVFHDPEPESEYSNDIGASLIMCFLALQAAVIFYLILNLIEGFYVAYKAIRKEGLKQGRLSCLQLITIPFQAGGMDFVDTDYQQMKRLESRMQTKKSKVIPITDAETALYDDKKKQTFSINKRNLDLDEPKESAKNELLDLDSRDSGRFQEGMISPQNNNMVFTKPGSHFFSEVNKSDGPLLNHGSNSPAHGRKQKGLTFVNVEVDDPDGGTPKSGFNSSLQMSHFGQMTQSNLISDITKGNSSPKSKETSQLTTKGAFSKVIDKNQNEPISLKSMTGLRKNNKKNTMKLRSLVSKLSLGLDQISEGDDNNLD